jgi:hypothetical protein
MKRQFKSDNIIRKSNDNKVVVLSVNDLLNIRGGLVAPGVPPFLN